MSAGPFKWKQALFAPIVLVQMNDECISVTEKGTTTTISYVDIKDVYVSMPGDVVSMLQVDILTVSNARTGFARSGWLDERTFEAEECRKAMIAFFDHLDRAVPDVPVFRGSRLSKQFNLQLIGTMLVLFAISAYLMTRESDGKLVWDLFTILVLAVIFLFSGWSARRQLSRTESVSAADMRDRLIAHHNNS
mgnify:CR=1 FL=1